jgi:hypothetical protein
VLHTASKAIEESIVEELARHDSTAHAILIFHNKLSKPVTLQAVYKALKKLVAEGVVLKHKNIFSLNNVWRREVISLFQRAEAFPKLQANESIIYSFKSLPQLDAYWKHIQEGSSNEVSVTYFFCPHQYWWFVPGRRESEILFYQQFEKNKRHAVLLLGGATSVDKHQRTLIGNSYVQVHAEAENTLHIEDTVTVKKDLIITTRLPRFINNQIHNVFKQNLSMERTEELLQKIFARKVAVKIRIERNAKKAEKLTKQIGKYFYIKQSS